VAEPAGRIPVLLNAGAGLTDVDEDELRARLHDAGAELHVVEPAALGDAVRAALAASPPVIGIAGGDGSLRTAAALIAGTDTALACIPTGTLNNFARRLGILDLDDAIAAIAARDVRALPVGTVHDGIFLNTLTFGEYSRIVRIRERLRRAVGKWPAALLASIAVAFSLRRVRVSLTTRAESLTRRTPFVWVGIGWGSFPRVHEALERRSSPDLEVAVLRSPTARAGVAFVFRIAWRMLRRELPVRDHALDVLHTRALTLHSRHRIDATADGEVLRLATPVEVGVRDAALRVLVAPRFEASAA
jgi:diacylglycerol kinase family enzyme